MTAMDQEREPFSFKEISVASDATEKLSDPIFVEASDGVRIAVRVVRPQVDKSISLVFYHGGGAHSAAGYQLLAQGLADGFGMTVYLPDLRGHGESGGPRGDAPSKEQVWKDVDAVLRFVDKGEDSSDKKDKRIFLGGHSSGGGLVVNYSTWEDRTTSVVIAGYVLVAPQLGYLSETARPSNGRSTFASVSILPFILNGIFGVLGHSQAVRFAYPSRVLEQDPRMVAFNTVNMANAITPSSPRQQLQSMSSKERIGLWIGSRDELFVPEKVTSFVPTDTHQRNVSLVVLDETHLGILVRVHECIGAWVSTATNNEGGQR